jgi:hypothetical protein
MVIILVEQEIVMCDNFGDGAGPAPDRDCCLCHGFDQNQPELLLPSLRPPRRKHKGIASGEDVPYTFDRQGSSKLYGVTNAKAAPQGSQLLEFGAVPNNVASEFYPLRANLRNGPQEAVDPLCWNKAPGEANAEATAASSPEYGHRIQLWYAHLRYDSRRPPESPIAMHLHSTCTARYEPSASFKNVACKAPPGP